MNLNDSQDISPLEEENNNNNKFQSSRLSNKNNLLISKDDKENNKEIINNNIDIQKEENNNNRDKGNDKKISNLLFLLKQMSDKQLYLLDVISNLQKNSSEQINTLNNRINNLEEKLKKQNSMNKSQEKEFFGNNYTLNENDPNIILSRILNGNNNEELINVCISHFPGF